MTDADGVVQHPFADKEPFEDIGWGSTQTGKGNGRFDWDDHFHAAGDARRGNGQHDAGEAGEAFTDTGVEPRKSGTARRGVGLRRRPAEHG